MKENAKIKINGGSRCTVKSSLLEMGNFSSYQLCEQPLGKSCHKQDFGESYSPKTEPE